jgi:threonine aldolase
VVYAPVPDDPRLPPISINLFSDTQTTPCPAMREAMARAPVVTVLLPKTNLVFFDAGDAGLSNERLAAALRAHGVLVSIMGGRLRACTHLDVSTAMVLDVLQIIRDVVQRHAEAFADSRPGRAHPIVLARTTVV